MLPQSDSATRWAISAFPASTTMPPGTPFGFQVGADDNNWDLVTTFDNGPATVLLSSNDDQTPNGISVGTASVQGGLATFSGLTVGAPGRYTLWVIGGGLTPVSFPILVVVPTFPTQPPTITMVQPIDQAILVRRGGHRRSTNELVGFEVTFDEALDTIGAEVSANYQLFQNIRHGRKTTRRPARFETVINGSSTAVSLYLLGKQTFTDGGELIVNSSGITNQSGNTLVGTTDFTILPNGQEITS